MATIIDFITTRSSDAAPPPIMWTSANKPHKVSRTTVLKHHHWYQETDSEHTQRVSILSQENHSLLQHLLEKQWACIGRLIVACIYQLSHCSYLHIWQAPRSPSSLTQISDPQNALQSVPPLYIYSSDLISSRRLPGTCIKEEFSNTPITLRHVIDPIKPGSAV